MAHYNSLWLKAPRQHSGGARLQADGRIAGARIIPTRGDASMKKCYDALRLSGEWELKN